MNPIRVQITRGEEGGKCTCCKEIAALVLADPICFGVYSVPFELLMSSSIPFGAWKDLQNSDSTGAKVVAVKPDFGGV